MRIGNEIMDRRGSLDDIIATEQVNSFFDIIGMVKDFPDDPNIAERKTAYLDR